MLNIVMFGAPGSGKGTQSDLIVDRFRLTHISTGDLLRAEIKAGSEIGKKVEGLIAEGKLVSDDIIVALLRKKVETTKDTAGFIFDGFPRNVAQAEVLDEILKGIGERVTVMLDMEVEEKTLIERLILRGQQSGRADDNMETIKNRLDVYRNVTLPVMDYYKKQGCYRQINNNGTVEQCFAQVEAAIEDASK
ncbi:MAG: adenylate kinase [bacterium]|uniref:Adenylate kinase n=1 Tax=Candidatus Aphodosoma intestinipullorum TaxID=2840674 RepID=A0A940DKH3_9BACT|nr:adenylate kinase [Candidatus Aphodosoma intestinipullorum]